MWSCSVSPRASEAYGGGGGGREATRVGCACVRVCVRACVRASAGLLTGLRASPRPPPPFLPPRVCLTLPHAPSHRLGKQINPPDYKPHSNSRQQDGAPQLPAAQRVAFGGGGGGTGVSEPAARPRWASAWLRPPRPRTRSSGALEQTAHLNASMNAK